MKICPRCGQFYDDYPALSRRCDVPICPECGREEAFEDCGLIDYKKPLSEWAIPPTKECDSKRDWDLYSDFCDDSEKMHDFLCMDKESFLESYSYLTETEWLKTYHKVMCDLEKGFKC